MGKYEHGECHLRRVKEVLAGISAPTVRCPNAATRARLPPRLSRRHVKLVTNTRDPTRRGGTSWPSPKAAPCTSPSSSRSEEHTSELQSLMRNSYAVFCLKKKTTHKTTIKK